MVLLVLVLMWESKRLKVGLQGCSPQDRLAHHILLVYYFSGKFAISLLLQAFKPDGS